jgi:hypothetical protein
MNKWHQMQHGKGAVGLPAANQFEYYSAGSSSSSSSSVLPASASSFLLLLKFRYRSQVLHERRRTLYKLQRPMYDTREKTMTKLIVIVIVFVIIRRLSLNCTDRNSKTINTNVRGQRRKDVSLPDRYLSN